MWLHLVNKVAYCVCSSFAERVLRSIILSAASPIALSDQAHMTMHVASSRPTTLTRSTMPTNHWASTGVRGTAYMPPTSTPVLFVQLVLSNNITVFQLYPGDDMMYEMRRKHEPIPLLTQWIYNIPHSSRMAWHFCYIFLVCYCNII